MNVQLTLPENSDPQAARSIEGAYRRAAQITERALTMDDNALARIRPSVASGSVELFLTTPLHSVVSQRIPGDIESETVLMARDLLVQLKSAKTGDTLQLIGGMDFMWTGTLPPLGGFGFVDTIPAEEIRAAHAAMGKENSDAAAPGGVARSLLEQEVVEVTSEEDEHNTVSLTGRHIAALGGLGVIAKPSQPELSEYDFVRVSVVGSWIRIDALYGTIYSPRPGGLARVPQPN